MHDFDYFLGRLGEPARWNVTERGRRDAHFPCPCCGGSDPLHVTERNERALVKCFSCGAGYAEVVVALEAEPGAEVAPIRINLIRRTTQAAPKLAPADAKADPLGWYAAYCGVAREFLDGLPLSATDDGWIAHGYGDLAVVKLRQAGTSERRWSPPESHNPAIWPLDDSMPKEIVLTEGESDCIALRGVGYPMAYSSGSASGVPSVSDFRSVAKRGVAMVFVAFDADEAGQRGAEKAMEHAMAAGLSAARIVPPDYDSLTGRGKDWREWVSTRDDDESLPESNIGQVIKSVARIRDETPSTVPWAAYPVAYFGGVSVLAGPPKGGKSTLLGHLARCAETGEQFLGEYDVERATPVLLMTEEHGIPVVMKTDAFGLTAAEVVQRGDAVRAGWGLADALAAAARWTTDNPRGVIVIDTLAVWAGIENENDAGETTAAMETIRHALADRGAAVVLVHHTRKGGGIAGEATRGSGAIAASCDVQAELTYYDASDATDPRRWLTVRGRVMETTRLLVAYDTATHSYAVEDTSAEQNAELLSWLDGVPRVEEDADGLSQKKLEELWDFKPGGGVKRIKTLLAKTLLRRSDAKVKVARGEEWRYWRSDAVAIIHRRSIDPPTIRDEIAAVESETGVSAPRADPTHEASDDPSIQGIGRSTVVGRGDGPTAGQRREKERA